LDAPATRYTQPKTGLDRLIDGLAVIAGMLMIGLVLLVCADVLVRNMPKVLPEALSPFLSDKGVADLRVSLESISIPWSLELAEYFLYAVTFLGAPWVLRDQGHIVVDLVLQVLSPASKRRAVFASHVIGAIVCLILCYYSFRVLLRSHAAGNKVVKTWTFPEWWPMLIVPPVFLILALIFLRWLRTPPELVSDEEMSDGL